MKTITTILVLSTILILSVYSVSFLACSDDDDDDDFSSSDVSGEWTCEESMGGSVANFIMSLLQNNETVTGSIHLGYPGGSPKDIEESTFVNNVLYFKLTYDHVYIEFEGGLVTSSRLEGVITSTAIDNPDYFETGTWYADS